MEGVKAKTNAGDDIVLKQPVVAQFKDRLRGELLTSADAGYDRARKVYNGMIDRHPSLIARCAGVADVMAAVDFARDNQLVVAVRGGGHNVGGFGTCDAGLVIDLSPMKGIRVDPKKQRARAEGGCTWGDLDHATHVFGLAAPGGIISTTGIAGLTLGGGIGHLTRKCGLSCDNLVSVDVVTADGRFVTAGAGENPDLFWGLRGGGGNFGIVTSFEFKLHPVHTVCAGPVLYRLEQAKDAMRFYRDYMAGAPEEMNGFFAFLIVPPGPPFPERLHNKTLCGIAACYSGPLDRAEKVVAPIRKFGPPEVDLLGPLPFPRLQRMFDALVPPGLQHYWKADFVHELSEEIIDAHVRFGPRIPTVSSAMHIYPVSGAAQRIGKEDTAFSYRDANFVHVIAAMYPDPADTPKNRAWVREYWEALHPHSAGGAYVNFLMADEGQDRIAATYRGNYSRLAALKKKYDPGNLFRLNQNIEPLA
ncbi:MAG: FAD-binding oxidoreductase [Acidobacteriia bacterium]|nr:FAD-binding oxidoreductase [Terriglobia bacterium]